MILDRAVMRFTGIMVLVSVALAYFHSQYWLLFTTFVGLDLLQASFTGFCPATIVLSKLGIKSGSVSQVAGASRSSED